VISYAYGRMKSLAGAEKRSETEADFKCLKNEGVRRSDVVLSQMV